MKFSFEDWHLKLVRHFEVSLFTFHDAQVLSSLKTLYIKICMPQFVVVSVALLLKKITLFIYRDVKQTL